MAHHIYTTDAFVLDSIAFGEANSFLYIFTRELGLIGASARSVREIRSKLRYGLQNFCYSSVSFVRGKREWKITSALPKKNLHKIFAEDKDKFLVCAHAMSLIKKLVTGEEKNDRLFDVLSGGFSFLETGDFSKNDLANFECIMMLRILCNLGYLTSDQSLKIFADTDEWGSELLAQMNPLRAVAISEINLAIKESQL